MCLQWLAPSSAAADPQAALGLTAGGVVQNAFGTGGPSGAFHIGGRADVLVLRNRGSDMGVGPYVDFATASLHDVDAGAGASWLLPIRDDLPLVVSGGAFLRNGEGRTWAPGVEGTVFFGARSYNFHSWYGMANGLFVQTRWVPAYPGTVDVVFGIQLDAELLAMPSMLIISALRN